MAYTPRLTADERRNLANPSSVKPKLLPSPRYLRSVEEVIDPSAPDDFFTWEESHRRWLSVDGYKYTKQYIMPRWIRPAWSELDSTKLD